MHKEKDKFFIVFGQQILKPSKVYIKHLVHLLISIFFEIRSMYSLRILCMYIMRFDHMYHFVPPISFLVLLHNALYLVSAVCTCVGHLLVHGHPAREPTPAENRPLLLQQPATVGGSSASTVAPSELLLRLCWNVHWFDLQGARVVCSRLQQPCRVQKTPFRSSLYHALPFAVFSPASAMFPWSWGRGKHSY